MRDRWFGFPCGCAPRTAGSRRVHPGNPPCRRTSRGESVPERATTSAAWPARRHANELPERGMPVSSQVRGRPHDAIARFSHGTNSSVAWQLRRFVPWEVGVAGPEAARPGARYRRRVVADAVGAGFGALRISHVQCAALSHPGVPCRADPPWWSSAASASLPCPSSSPSYRTWAWASPMRSWPAG